MPELGDGEMMDDIHCVRVYFDDKLIREDTTVEQARLMYYLVPATATTAARYVWAIECDTLQNLDMNDGQRQT